MPAITNLRSALEFIFNQQLISVWAGRLTLLQVISVSITIGNFFA